LGYLRFSLLGCFIHRHYWDRLRRFRYGWRFRDGYRGGSFAHLLRGFLGDGFYFVLLHLFLEGFGEAGKDERLDGPSAAVGFFLHEVVELHVFGANKAQLDPLFTLS
jgi:hypothetical protein